MSDTAVDPRGCPTTGAPPADADDVVDPTPFMRRSDDGLDHLELLVRGAHCAGCIRKIENGVGALAGVDSVRLNLSTGKLAVAFDARRTPAAAVARKITNLGYHAAPFDPAKAAADVDHAGRELLRCMAVAGFAAMNVMLLSISVWAGFNGEMSEATRGFFHWTSGLIAMPAAAYAGRPFFRSAWRALRRGSANMDVPISLAVVSALALSVYEASAGGEHAYFDAAVMLLFFLLVGRWLDHKLRGRARAAARELLALQNPTASRMDDQGNVRAVATRDVRPGDRLVLAAGDRVPVDVVIEDGSSDIDRSLATGESAPVAAAQGDTLPSGVLNLTRRLIVRATAAAQDSFLADLARLIETGEQAKTRYVKLADKAAALYVPLVHGAAALTLAAWLLAGAGVRDAATSAIALLIITCPCALGLAVPAVQVVATGRLFKRGVLVKSGDALERLAEADHVVFDKTGTLTHGRLSLANFDELTSEDLETAARLARASRHPISRAVADIAGRGPLADEVAETPGLGLEGRIDGKIVRLGAAAWAGAAPRRDDAGPVAWLMVEGRAPVRFAFHDAPRADAAAVVRALKARGFGVEMLTGDALGPAKAVAEAIGLSYWKAEVSPEQKAARLDELALEGKRVLMVGDGLNDAPALARAHVSMSPGTAAEASQHAADFVIQGEGLSSVLDAVAVSKGAKRRVLENFGFAAAYNLVAAPLAAFGFVTPLIAAIAMSSSSLIVTLNALRLAGGRK